MEESILNYFPINIQKKIYGQVENFTNLEEIRIRTNKPIILNTPTKSLDGNTPKQAFIKVFNENLYEKLFK